MSTNWSPEAYDEAYRFAGKAHAGQLIRGTRLPYIMHVSLVAMEVMAALTEHPELDGNFAVQCALLHDTIEDTAVSKSQLAAHFGPKVANGVEALSKNDKLPKADQMADSLERIKHQPIEVWLVKLADRIVNLSPPPADWSAKKITAYHFEANLIHAELHNASKYLSDRLSTKVNDYAHHIG